MGMRAGAPVMASVRPAGPIPMGTPMGAPVGGGTATATAPAAPAGAAAADPAKPKKKVQASTPLHVMTQVGVCVVGLVLGYYAMVAMVPSANFLNLNLPGLDRVNDPTEPPP